MTIEKFLLIALTVSQAQNFQPFSQSFSQTTQGIRWSGNTQTRNHWISCDVRENHLDIVEEVEIAPIARWSGAPLGDPNTLEIAGTFRLGVGTAITGILIWNGDDILKGKLKPSELANQEYEEVVDRNTSPPPRPRDPFFVRQTGSSPRGDTYEYKIYPASFEEYRKVRIRYLIPLGSGIHAGMFQRPFPVFMDRSRKGKFHLEIKSTNNISHILSADSETTTELPARNTYAYADYPLAYFSTASSTVPKIYATEFDSGYWKGHYGSYHFGIPKVVLNENGLIRETVFLWKWNHPESFFEVVKNTSASTEWGQMARAQAKAILDLSLATWNQHGEVGLVFHVGDRHRPLVKPMGGANSREADDIRELLDAVHSESYWDELKPLLERPNDPEYKYPTASQNGIIGFEISIRSAIQLFSEKENRIQSLYIVTAGPIFEDDILDLRADFDFPENILLGWPQIHGNDAEWPGVDIRAFLRQKGVVQPAPAQALTEIGVQKIRAIAKVAGSDFIRTFNIPSPGSDLSTGLFKWDIHSLNELPQTIDLELLGQSDVLIGKGKQTLPKNFTPRDTNLIKLFSRSATRNSDVYLSGSLGSVFGTVDQNHSLLALESDVLAADQGEAVEVGGIPHLTDDEIFGARTVDASSIISPELEWLPGIRIYATQGKLRLKLTGENKGWFWLFSIEGKLLMEGALNSEIVEIPLIQLSGTVFIMRIKLGKRIYLKRINLMAIGKPPLK